jgi:hypothetical protein
MRVSRHFCGTKIMRMIQRSERFDGLGAGITGNLRKKLSLIWRANIFFHWGVQSVHGFLMNALFPMGCDFNGEDGDALGSEYADENW